MCTDYDSCRISGISLLTQTPCTGVMCENICTQFDYDIIENDDIIRNYLNFWNILKKILHLHPHPHAYIWSAHLSTIGPTIEE